MIIHLVAYAGTGKDTLYKNLKDLQSLGWYIFGPIDQKDSAIFPASNGYRIALADKLKIMVAQKLKLDQIQNPSEIHPIITVTHQMSAEEWFNGGWLDKIKDIPVSEINLKSLNGKTFRQCLIDYGDEMKRLHGDDYFIKAVYPDIQEKVQQGMNVFLTDTRYPYETLPSSLTIRLFRSDVPIADLSVHSERSMDSYQCSYVFCKNQEDFKILKSKQTQYNDYVCYGYLTQYSK